jgi:predicted 3-demethylubiquinone-9 3-methyltransferase (glyoxalase superfamily)
LIQTGLFPNSAIQEVSRYGAEQTQENPEYINYARCNLGNSELVVMESSMEHAFGFNEAVSLLVECDTQEEIDTYWNTLSAVPDAEQCGWLKDKYGVSWQIAPRVMSTMMSTGTSEQIARVVQAFLPMKKFDIATLEQAFAG